MNTKPYRSLFLTLLAAVVAVVSMASAAEPPGTRPNIVFVLCDDIRWDCLGVAGHPYLKTPNIDQLAKEGVLFRNSFCTTSLCSPSRASILSGLYAHSHGVVNNFTEFPANLPSFPRTLQSTGYDTAYIGKWHMGEDNDEPRPGFHHFITHKGQGKYFDTEFNINGQGSKVIKGYYTTVVTDMALDWMHRDRPENQPYLLMIGHKAPHSFYYPEPKYEQVFDKVKIEYPESAFTLDDKPGWIRERLPTWHGIYGPLFDYRRRFPDSSPEAVKDFAAMTRAYWGTILSVDDSIGRIRAELERRGELANTIFVFMGDNGLLSGEHGMVDKRTMHEPSIRVPLVVRYPKLASGKAVDAQVLTLDIAPSLLDLCDAPPLDGIHGQSWKRVVQGDTEGWRNAWYYEYDYEKQFPYTPNVRGIRTDRWKYIHYPHDASGSPDSHMAELYDLENDPDERTNLISDPAQAERIEGLKAQLVQLQKDADGWPDRMPTDEGIKTELPDQKIR